MSKTPRIALLVLGTLAAAPALDAQALLATGTVLVYTTPDGTDRAWVVEEATADLAHAGRTGCMRVRYAAGGPTAGPDERITCISGDSLLRWSVAATAWQLARPLAPRDSVDLPLRSGLARYLTGDVSVDTISGLPVPVLATVILTIDTAGRVIRRLQERYAPGLGTATAGRFEVPDSTSPGGWRTTQAFGLSAIRRPD